MILNKIIRSNFFSFFVILIIPSLISGPFLPNLIMGLSSFIFLIFVIKKKFFFLFKNSFFYFLFFFCIICIFSSLLSDDIIFSLKTSLFYFRVGIFAALISFLISTNKQFIKYFFLMLSLTYCILIIDGFFQYFNGYNLIGLSVEGWDKTRISSFFGNELILGSFLSRFLPIYIAIFLILEKKIKIKNFFFILLILVSSLIFLSGERASFFILLLTFFFLFLIKFEKKFFLLFSIFILISIFSYSNPKLFNRMSINVLKDFQLIKENNQAKQIDEKKIIFFSDGHDNLIRTAYNMFRDKPILGIGPNMFRKKCSNLKYINNPNKHFCDTHPHNFYIQILAETGVLGALIILVFLLNIIYKLLVILKNIYSKKINNNYQILILAGLFITLFPLTTNGNFFNSWLASIYSILLGFYLNTFYNKKFK
jgi:hypothetical protein